MHSKYYSVAVQDFPLGGGGAPTSDVGTFRQKCMYAKTKELDPVGGGGARRRRPPRSANATACYLLLLSAVICSGKFTVRPGKCGTFNIDPFKVLYLDNYLPTKEQHMLDTVIGLRRFTCFDCRQALKCHDNLLKCPHLQGAHNLKKLSTTRKRLFAILGFFFNKIFSLGNSFESCRQYGQLLNCHLSIYL